MSLGARRAAGASIIVAFALAIVLAPTVAHADDLDEFFFARDAYSNSDYGSAIERLRNMLARRPPITSTLIEPVRKYLFASLVLTEQRSQAVALLEQMLRENPDLQFAPRDFSGAVTQVVFDTRTRLAPELERIRAERFAAARAAEEQRERERRARQAALVDSLTRERVLTRTPRSLMFVPFGVGQFANGNYGLGAMFLALQLASLGTAVTGHIAWENIAAIDYRPDRQQCHISTCTAIAAATISGWSVFGAAVIAGIVQANLAWTPERVEIRRRPLPPGIGNVQLSGGPTPDGVSIGATWRF